MPGLPSLLPTPSVDTVREVLRLLTGGRWIPPGSSHAPQAIGTWYSAEHPKRRARVSCSEVMGHFKVEVDE